jgi:hypothetical protein
MYKTKEKKRAGEIWTFDLWIKKITTLLIATED